GCCSVRRAWQLACKRFVTIRGDIISAPLSGYFFLACLPRHPTEARGPGNRQVARAQTRKFESQWSGSNPGLSINQLDVDLFAELGSFLANVSLPTSPTRFWTLITSPRLVTRLLQVNCQARQTGHQPPDLQPISVTDLPTFEYIVSMVVVGLFAELGNLIANVSSPIEVTSSGTTTNPPLRTTTLHKNALMMSPRLVMKRLQSNCPAQRTS
ncbi:LOW QUALITY PROTEIN: hypothetical protein T265_15061, partial [Opisthorchis viverrini]